MRLRARKANEQDFTLLLQWYKDPLIHNMVYNPFSISIKTHRDHFKGLVNQHNVHLLVIEQWGDSDRWLPIGQAQVDRNGTMSIFLASEFRGKHLGHPAIKTVLAYSRRDPAIKKLVAHIHINNTIASVKAFTSAGFHFVCETTIKGKRCFEYTFTIPRREYGLFY